MPPWTPATVILLLLLVAVATADLATHRIPNWLTLSALVLAFPIHYLSSGASGLLSSAAGMAVGLAVFFPLYLTGNFGAGDVKAMAAVGALLGPLTAFFAVIGTLLAGFCAGLLVFAVTAGPTAFRQRLRRWSLGAYTLYTTGQLIPQYETSDRITMRDAAKRRFPYGVAIACGTFAALIWTSHHG